MKKFRFSLETVQKVRKKKEDEALREFGQAQRELQKEFMEKRRIENQLDDSLLRREKYADQGANAHLFSLEESFIQGLKQNIENADKAIIRARRNLEKAFYAYLTARKKSAMIDKIHDRRLEEFKKIQNKKENKELDDLYVMRSKLKKEIA